MIMADNVERIPQHRHCVNCGRAFVGEGRFCSDSCRETATDEVRGKLRKYGLIWLAIVAVTAVLLFIMI